MFANSFDLRSPPLAIAINISTDDPLVAEHDGQGLWAADAPVANETEATTSAVRSNGLLWGPFMCPSKLGVRRNLFPSSRRGGGCHPSCTRSHTRAVAPTVAAC